MRRTKIIVITGYILLVLLSILGIAWVYMEWLHYMRGAAARSQYRKELLVLGNTLVTMYHAGSSVGLLAFASDPQMR
ncbi:MAG: hypothetical protein LBB64_03975, partial [Dysgonamonadaceae bacterium]|nr:hypothetical protein [Dysgonamonadaceae bacterium]